MNRPGPALPTHLHPRSIGLVLVGGTLGTAARAALAHVFPPVDGVPYAILVINVTGAFLLGMLLGWLSLVGGESSRHRNARLLAGTGFLGGFTTYSALAADTALLLGGAGAGAGAGALYALATLLIGGLASWCGIATASAIHRRRDGGDA